MSIAEVYSQQQFEKFKTWRSPGEMAVKDLLLEIPVESRCRMCEPIDGVYPTVWVGTVKECAEAHRQHLLSVHSTRIVGAKSTSKARLVAFETYRPTQDDGDKARANVKRKWTKESLVKWRDDYRAEHKKNPSTKTQSLYDPVKREFGSWQAFMDHDQVFMKHDI